MKKTLLILISALTIQIQFIHGTVSQRASHDSIRSLGALFEPFLSPKKYSSKSLLSSMLTQNNTPERKNRAMEMANMRKEILAAQEENVKHTEGPILDYSRILKEVKAQEAQAKKDKEQTALKKQQLKKTREEFIKILQYNIDKQETKNKAANKAALILLTSSALATAIATDA